VKIICELHIRETGKIVTTHEIEADMFALNMNNPFPASVAKSAIFNSRSAHCTYEVAEAFGNQPTFGAA